MARPPIIALIAGEVSGDQLGGWLMAALKARQPAARFIGLGGPMMEAQGLHSLFPIRDIALIGIAEVVPHIRTLKRRIHEMVLFLEREKPDIVITIDVPGFALRVLKQLHARGKIRPKLVHYVAPTVWAYRAGRAKIVAERYDHLLCLLPFEPPYFEKEGLKTSYIGHEIAWWWKIRGDGAMFRRHHALPTQSPLLAVFPGSRNGEINRLWPVFREAITRLKQQTPALDVVIQVPTSLMDRMKNETAEWDVKPLLIPNTDDKRGLFAAATAALAKSGTIGLECALAGLPSVIAYRANPISAFLLRQMIKVPYVNLANILAGKMIIPELLQKNCSPEKLTAALTPLLTDETARNAQRSELGKIAQMLGANDEISPSQKAVKIIMSLLGKQDF
jgi:lipid-A-disaccharide synthase